MTEKVTDWAEILGALAMALGFAWLTAERLGIGWGLMAFGTAILVTSAVVAALANRGKGGVE